MPSKKKHSKIAIVIGTKAELIKCFPVMLELQKRKLDYWFIHTGQHPLGASCKEFGVKTALYSGLDTMNPNLFSLLDYYKVGSYKKKYGGLDKPFTNQRLYKIEDMNFKNITHLFWRKDGL